MFARTEAFLIQRFCSRPGPLSYLVMLASWFIGLVFAFFSFLPDIKESIIYQSDVLASPVAWGAVMLAGASVTLTGMCRRSNRLVKCGSMVTFVMWTFALIAYAATSHWYAAISFSGVHAMIQAHFYLSAAFDTLFERV